jgi:hypothetical protein
VFIYFVENKECFFKCEEVCACVCVNVADFVSQILTNRSEPIIDIDVSQVWTAQYRVSTVQYRTVKKSRVYSVQ